MHLFDVERRFMGGFAIVAGQMPLAVGLGLAIDYRDEDTVVVCMFGDGAINQGAFHESLNLAKLWNLPVIFLCENNLYGMGTAVSRATSLVNIARHGCAYGIPGYQVDGMDVMAVRKGAESAARAARSGQGPSLIEAITYRYRGHSMADPLHYRTTQEVEIWQERDPLNTFAGRLIHEGIATEDELKELQDEVVHEVESATAFAEESPNPPLESLMEGVYMSKPYPALGLPYWHSLLHAKSEISK